MASRPHVVVRSLLICGAAASLMWAAETTPPVPTNAVPWTESFSMVISGQDRVFAVYHGGNFMVLAPADATNRTLLLGQKDVVITAKFERDGVTGTRQRVRLSCTPRIERVSTG